MYTQLQLREVFHLEFLRWLGRKVKPQTCVLKGGSNLRFFFKSQRYSEDMDMDVAGLGVHMLQESVMGILSARSFCDLLRPFGIQEIVPPDLSKAKQTETTQRFKVHLLTTQGEDLFTKVEFSRRGSSGNSSIESIDINILRAYKLPPLIVAHYDAHSAVMQKVNALASRTVTQARDVFDLNLLRSQVDFTISPQIKIGSEAIRKACDNVFQISFEQFRDAVISYLSYEDQVVYNDASVWDDMKLHVARFIEELNTQMGTD